MGRMIFIGPEEILKNKIAEKEASNTTRSHEDIVTESIIEMENTIDSVAKSKNEAEREFANQWKKEILKIKLKLKR